MRYRLFHKVLPKLLLFNFLSLTSKAAAFDFTNPDSIRQKAQQVLGELNPDKLFDAITGGISSYTSQLSAYLALCLAVIIISSVFSVMSHGKSSENIFGFIGICLTVLILFSPLTRCFLKVQEHIEAISGFMFSFIPTGVILHTASGNTLSAALMSSALPSAVTILQLICVSLLLPISKACLSLTAINSLCENPAVEGLYSTLKGVALWICGLVFTFFTGIISLQTVLQAGADNLAMKGIRYGAAKLIPVAGGMISESLKTVISGMKYIKSITGISGILFIIYTLIPPLCFIISTKFCLTVLLYAAKICEQGKIKTFLEGAQGIINILLALLLASGVSFIIILAMFMATNVHI